jgi:AcrR family transcriptional regulator
MTIVDRDGLERLSMRRLAAELGMSPMSLYYHVPDKSALYDLILDAVMADMDLPHDDPTRPAEERVVEAAAALRAALLAHPDAIPIVLSRSLRTPGQLRPVEAMLGMLFDAGMPPTDALAVVNIVAQYVLGTTAALANHLTDAKYHDARREAEFDELSPTEFPHVTRLLREGTYLGFEAEFDRGLRTLVHGLLAKPD